MKRFALLIFIILISGFVASLTAEIRLPAFFGDHMVLQQGKPLSVWGWGEVDEVITVSYGSSVATATVGDDGKWKVVLPTMVGGQTGELRIQGTKSNHAITLQDVVAGEVWLASGQSNMEHSLLAFQHHEEIAKPEDAQIRQFIVKSAGLKEPQEDCQGQWEIAGPKTRGNFSATGYYFARALQRDLNVPVGFINASVGGTPIESWISREGIASVPELKEASDRKWQQFLEYPTKKTAFIKEFGAALTQFNREDQVAPEGNAYSDKEGTEGEWRTVKVPGPISIPGFSGNGVVWLRREVTMPIDSTKKTIWLRLYQVQGFPSVYWNGKLIKSITYNDHPGKGSISIELPKNLINAGKNSITIRIFAPFQSPSISDGPRIGDIWIGGEWQARVERNFPVLDKAVLEKIPAVVDIQEHSNYLPSGLFNGLIHPLVGYAFKGMIWYQGEANVARAWQYRTAFPVLIQDWRKRWNQEHLSFYFCQLANQGSKTQAPGESGWAELREAQTLALSLPNTGQAVLIDVGEIDIHPSDKQSVGDRLARIALAKDYGRKISSSGPVYKSMKIEGSLIRLEFDNSEGGLEAREMQSTYPQSTLSGTKKPLIRNSPNSQLEGFAICGTDRKWYWANAKIVGESVIVWSDNVSAPIAVRYAWADNPTVNLYNTAGLPAAPFRTDDFPAKTVNKKL